MKILARKDKKYIYPGKKGQFADMWRRLRRNKIAMLGLIIITIIILLAIFADVIADYETQVIGQDPHNRLMPPSGSHPFGTDAFGRDLFSRVLHGARFSLSFGLGCTFLSLVGGCLFGASAAFFGGKVDNIIMRLVDVFISIPSMLLALSMVAALGPGLRNLMIALVISNTPHFVRMIRVIVLTVVRQDYIEAAHASGVKDARIIVSHVLPNAIGPIIINAMMSVSGVIIAASGLSFIGMGIQPPAPEWGAMLNEAITFMRLHPHVVIFPGLAIVITALSINLLGDGLTDALDPRMKD